METIDLTPTWEMAVNIYIQVLMNHSDPTGDAVQTAKDDLILLAKIQDRRNSVAAQEGQIEADPNQIDLLEGVA